MGKASIRVRPSLSTGPMATQNLPVPATDAGAAEMAQAARIATLEEELLIARERARTEGDELEALRRQLRAKEIAHQDVVASERLAKAELIKSSGEAQKLEETVGAQLAELRA